MNFLMNELPQIRPVLFVQAGNVVSVDVGEVGFRHGSCTHVLSRFLPQSRATQKFCNRDQNLRKRSGYVPPFGVDFRLSRLPQVTLRESEVEDEDEYY